MLRVVQTMNSLALKGHSITIMSKDGKVFYDMDTMAKSHLYIYAIPVDNKLMWEARYDRTGEIDLNTVGDNLEEVITALVFNECMCGKDYASSTWFERFTEYGLNT